MIGDRRHGPARADAGLGRLDPGAEGGDHGDPGRDRGQQARPPGGEDDGERGALDPRARPRARRGSRRSCSPRPRAARASPSSGRRSSEHRAHLEQRRAARGAAAPEPRGRGVRGRVGAGEGSTSSRRSRTIPSCGGCSTRSSAGARPADGGTRDHGEGVPRCTTRDGVPTLADIQAARERPRTASRGSRPVYASETFSRLAGRRGAAQGREPPAHGRRSRSAAPSTRSRSLTRRASARRASSRRAPATTARRSPGRRARPASRRGSSCRRTRRWRRSRRARNYGAEIDAGRATRSRTRSRPRAPTRGDGRDLRPPVRGPGRDRRARARSGSSSPSRCPRSETVLIPIGGGGLASGIALALRAMRPEVRLVGVRGRAGLATRSPTGSRSSSRAS